MERTERLVALAVYLSVPIALLRAQPADPDPQDRSVAVPRLASRPRLEQFLDGAARADMKRIDDFRQRRPGNGDPVSQPTTAWIGYDQHNFYAVFRCIVPPGEIRARMSKREDMMSDDLVGLLLDTYHSGQRRLRILPEPPGNSGRRRTQRRRPGRFQLRYPMVLRRPPHPEGYLALFAVPFRSLRFPARAEQTWGIALYRSLPTTNEDSYWPFITQEINSFAPQFATMAGPGAHLARTQSPTHPLRRLQPLPLPRFRHPARPRLPLQDRLPPRNRRQGRRSRHAHVRPHIQSRFQPGRIGRPASLRQSALRNRLPGEAPLLPRKHQLLLYP